ncbi:hypothetical protein WN48_05654 [Eufriesea mexicana]|nr:hypothetical protein WN48_05654 [Eufriesea mexicana]
MGLYPKALRFSHLTFVRPTHWVYFDPVTACSGIGSGRPDINKYASTTVRRDLAGLNDDNGHQKMGSSFGLPGASDRQAISGIVWVPDESSLKVILEGEIEKEELGDFGDVFEEDWVWFYLSWVVQVIYSGYRDVDRFWIRLVNDLALGQILPITSDPGDLFEFQGIGLNLVSDVTELCTNICIFELGFGQI